MVGMGWVPPYNHWIIKKLKLHARILNHFQMHPNIISSLWYIISLCPIMPFIVYSIIYDHMSSRLISYIIPKCRKVRKQTIYQQGFERCSSVDFGVYPILSHFNIYKW